MKRNLIIIISICSLVIIACSSPSDNDNKKNGMNISVTGNTHYWNTKHKIFYMQNTFKPVFYTNVFDETKTYTVTFKGVYLGGEYTFNLSSHQSNEIDEDSTSTSLNFSFSDINMSTDYYEAIINDGSKTSKAMYAGETAYFYDGNASDFACLIQMESNSWVPRDSLLASEDNRMRPYPSLINTSGKLYFYNSNMVEKGSLSSNGASGQVGSDGITRWYSLKFSGTNVTALEVNKGKYLVRWENSERNKFSPFIEINLVK